MEELHRFFSSELAPGAPEDARFHVIPVPYEKTVSYGGGTQHGPAALLEASDQLELWNGFSVPAEHGIYTQPFVDCSGDAESVLSRIQVAVRAALDVGGLPILLGGEHTVTLGALRELHAEHGEFGIIQFDAHADLRDEYEGSKLSHACVMRRAVSDLGLPLFQLGVRALCEEEEQFRVEHGIPHHDGWDIGVNGISHVSLPEVFPKKVYVTFDVDGLDASIMPATGTPVPGGIQWYQALQLLQALLAGRQCIGADVVELAPISGLHYCEFTAAQLCYNIMGFMR
ncbi:agmatinase [Desulfobaculum bizertense DSM 18034]|uniref:Agmatinase n=1 Tax=Desulfobaculum bizertense DSM 18034 TaxID=1121442 RepID=A0A1T4WRV8_9BACT|nr:agmatinase [Desulfobaculum bizertense DSM 18034]